MTPIAWFDTIGFLCGGAESYLSINSTEQLINRIEVAVHQILLDQCLAAIGAVCIKCNACITAKSQHFEQYLH